VAIGMAIRKKMTWVSSSEQIQAIHEKMRRNFQKSATALLNEKPVKQQLC